jgi:hypothetical protein
MKNNHDYTKENIETNLSKIAEDIRQYCRDQKELWQTIPHLALETAGRGSSSERYSTAYRTGYWSINGGTLGVISMAVDLLTGELVCFSNGAPIATDLDIVRHIIPDLSRINAGDIISMLKEEILRFEEGDTENVKKWRQGMREKYGVQKIAIVRKYGLKISYWD